MPLYLYFMGSWSLDSPRELSSADITNERFFSGVCSDVRGQMVAATKGAHADAALERLLT